MKNKILLLSFVSVTLLACGKQGEKPDFETSRRFRYIDPIVEGNFEAQEKNLGLAFCNALKYKRENFITLYANSSFPRQFMFSMEQKACESKDAAPLTQGLRYSPNGGISYIASSGTGPVPSLDTDAQGVFTTYCANKTQNSRVFKNGSEMKVYRFLSGEGCGGTSNEICAVYERAPLQNPETTNYKLVRMSRGTFLGRDLQGQEVYSLEQVDCSGNDFQMLKYTLSEVRDN